METNNCDVNYLDSDALLPPRKRLLAGLKRQSSDVNLPPPTMSAADSDFSNRLNNLLNSRLSNPNLSNEELVEASKVAALEAATVAAAARAKADEKAAISAKAFAAAKSALDLVATLSEDTSVKAKSTRKNKVKKHVPVEALYNKRKTHTNGKTDEEVAQRKTHTNGKTDEEVARNLHRAINSSPRITKNAGSELKSYKHKKLKTSSFINNGVMVAEPVHPSTVISNGNGNGIVRMGNPEGSVKEVEMITVDLNGSTSGKGDQVTPTNEEGKVQNKIHELKFGNGAMGPLLSKDKLSESLDSVGIKKRGERKQKSLPLGICNYRDQTIPKDHLTPVEIERTKVWKCQSSFKGAPDSVKQKKVMQP